MKVLGIGIIRKTRDTYRLLSEPAKAAAWFTVCCAVQRGMQFVAMPVLTRIMPVQEYGVYTAFLSWANLISVFTSLGIYGNVFQKAMIRYGKQRKEYISSVQWLTAACTVFVILIIYMSRAGVPELQGSYLWLMSVYLFFFPAIQYWYQIQRFEFKYKALAGVTLAVTMTGILLGIFWAMHSEKKGLAVIAAAVFSQSVAGFVFFVKIAFEGKVFYQKEYWNWSLKLALPLIPASLSEILLGHADRIMIRYLCGASLSAVYTTVYQLSMLVTVIRMGINGSYIPWLYHALQKKKYESIQRMIKFIIFIYGSLTVFAMLLGQELMKAAAPELYQEAAADLPAIMLGCFFVSLYYLFEQIELFYEKVMFSTVTSVMGAVVNIILNLIFITRTSYLAAGYTTMASYAVMAVLHAGYIKYLGRKQIEITDFFDFRYILSVSAGLAGAGILCLALYQTFFLIRYGIILAMLAALYCSRQKITDMVSVVRRCS